MENEKLTEEELFSLVDLNQLRLKEQVIRIIHIGNQFLLISLKISRL